MKPRIHVTIAGPQGSGKSILHDAFMTRFVELRNKGVISDTTTLEIQDIQTEDEAPFFLSFEELILTCALVRKARIDHYEELGRRPDVFDLQLKLDHELIKKGHEDKLVGGLEERKK